MYLKCPLCDCVSNFDPIETTDSNENPNPNANPNDSKNENLNIRVVTPEHCPICLGVEPKRIEGLMRSRHPLYSRWAQFKSYEVTPPDMTFKYFTLFVKWFRSQTSDSNMQVHMRDSLKGYNVQNCYVDPKKSVFGRKTTLDTFTDIDKENLKTLIEKGFSIAQVAKAFGLNHATAKNLVAEYQRREKLAKYA